MPHDLADAQSIAAAHRELRTQLPVRQVHLARSGYADGVALWNGAVKHRPALLLTCTSTEDVCSACAPRSCALGPLPGPRLAGAPWRTAA